MKYEDIEKVNKEITTVDIKGKPYAEVHKRITAFRKLQPNGSIQTEIISNLNGVVVMKATIINEDGKVLGIGHSYETENVGFINKTSYIENCETSAIGRALGMCGFGIDTSLASYEEVDIAIKKQSFIPKSNDDIKNQPIFQSQIEMIEHDLLTSTKYTLEQILNGYKVNSLSALTWEQGEKIKKALQPKEVF